LTAPAPLITPANKYILAVLNSKIGDRYIRSLGVTRNGGYFEYKPMFIEKLPIPQISMEQQRPFEVLVDMILFAKAHSLESEAERIDSVIDLMVFALYFKSEMRAVECCIADYLKDKLHPFKPDDSDEFKRQYIAAFYAFSNQDKDVFRCLKFAHHLVKPLRIIYGGK
jgi:hypothetical protein